MIIALCAFLLLVVGFYVVENVRGLRAWEAEKSLILSKGGRLRLVDIAHELPPDEDNFAKIPLLRPLYDYTRDEQDVVTWLGEDPIEKARLPEDLLRKFPRGSRWWTGEQTELEEWCQEFIATNELDQGLTPADAMHETRLLIDSQSDKANEIAAGLRRPYSVFPLHYHELEVMLLGHLGPLRQMAQLFQYQSLIDILDSTRAVDIEGLGLSFQIAKSIESDQILISALVQRALIDISNSVVKDGLWHRRFSVEQITRIEAWLSMFDMLKRAERAFEAERTFCLEYIDRLRDAEASRMGLYLSESELKRVNLLIRIAPAGWFDQNKASYARMMRTVVLPLVDADRGVAHMGEIFAARKRLTGEVSEHPLYSFSVGYLSLSLTGHVSKFATTQTGINLAVTACALERFWIEHGEYPDALGELEPVYLETVPHDVMTGEPLKYRHEGERFVLYSVGLNGVDDGGVVVFDPERAAEVNFDEGDLVWQYPVD